ncbi:MAG: phosphodiester glycosidase family protein [Clostridia bacterium]|nr:phosphodiester glycosidase family protein [Clostridia bacterium]
MLKRILCLLAGLMMLLPAALAEAPAAEPGAFPVLNEDGFLDVGEFVYSNPEAGVWRYVDDSLKVEIYRRTGKNQKGNNAVWYEAEVWSRGDEAWQIFTNVPGKHMSSADWPHVVARKNHTVLAINTDYAQSRYANRKNDSRIGIVMRNGKAFSSATLKSTSKKWPPLDVLALYPDGNMEVYTSDEHTLEDYQAMGVQTTLAFGPYLIRDGVRNDADASSMSIYNNPRTAIGMIEKGHTFVIMVEGRVKNSVGSDLTFLADRMAEKGCTMAFNLDGGRTACILFMGEQLNAVEKGGYARSTTEILGIGVSELVPDHTEK